jgi:hypothetical protein
MLVEFYLQGTGSYKYYEWSGLICDIETVLAAWHRVACAHN